MRNLLLLLLTIFLFTNCEKPQCNDGLLNGDETLVDCGGMCGPCYTCDDGIKNQTETLVDCGGYNCDYCQHEWIPQLNPILSSNNGQKYPTNIAMIDENIIFAVGRKGTIVKTEDGGESWQETIIPELKNVDLVKIDFYDENLGVIIGEELQNGLEIPHVYLTQDGGLNWNKILISANCLDAQIISPKLIYFGCINISYKYNIIQQTIDTLFDIDIGNVKNIDFFNEQEGYISVSAPIQEEEGLFWTSDGGDKWTKLNDHNFYSKSLTFLTNQFGYGAIDSERGWATTTDGGTTWNLISFPFSIFTEVKVLFATPMIGYVFSGQGESAVTENTLGYKTTDGGLTWIPFGYFNEKREDDYVYLLLGKVESYRIIGNKIFALNGRQTTIYLIDD